jgi:magnesium transporter
MEKTLNFGKIRRIHLSSPTKEEINKLIRKYDFHELIEEDLIELSTQEKIDVYEDYIFIVLNFPKYNADTKKYMLNEFSIILGKGVVVTMTRFETNHIQKIIEDYQKELEEREKDENFKISTYYILYKIIDTMYDKTFDVLNKSSRDVTLLEEQIFGPKTLEKKLLENLMIKKRNIAFLRHAFLPHRDILVDLQNIIPKFYKEDLDVYFEDLSSKLDKILNNISISFENIESVSETYNSLMTIKTNSMISVLTIFSAVT